MDKFGKCTKFKILQTDACENITFRNFVCGLVRFLSFQKKTHKQCMVQKLTLFEKQSVQDQTNSTFLYHLVLLLIIFRMSKEAK